VTIWPALATQVAQCGICFDATLTAEEAAEQIGAACGHAGRAVCDACLRNHIREEVLGKGAAKSIRCPQAGCGATMAHREASTATLTRSPPPPSRLTIPSLALVRALTHALSLHPH
jgi:hypothetical protein